MNHENPVYKKEINDFDLEQTLECGQCFRFEKIEEQRYYVSAGEKFLEVSQKENIIEFYHTTQEEIEEYWIQYFDMKRDYGKIKQNAGSVHPVMKEVVQYKPNIRLLRQDPWETLLSFIISQNKRISHIQQVVGNICKAYGRQAVSQEGLQYWTFPTAEELSWVTDEEFRKCKAGFRAPYLVDACNKILQGEIDLEAVEKMDTQEARSQLMKIKGVGEKIADCVLLFAYGRYEVFPTDVWIKRIMEQLFFNRRASIQEIHEFAEENFGGEAGFIQQYLFYYAKDKKIGK